MKKVTALMNKFIKFIIQVIDNCVSAISEDKLLFVFLIVATIPNFIIKISSGMVIFDLRSLLFNFTWYTLIVALSFKFRKNHSRIVFFSIITFIMFALSYSNIMYYRYYESFLSISLIKQLSLFSDVADATSVGMSTFDIVYWLLFILSLTMIIFFTKNKKYNYDKQNYEFRYLNRLNFLRLSLIVFVTGFLTLEPANYSQVEKFWNRPAVVKSYGLYNYHLVDVFKSMGIFFRPKPDEEDYAKFLNYFEEKNKINEDNEYTNILKGKNIIVIHAESLENFVINYKLGDQEITPNFNRLANEGLYFDHFYSQQSIGTSADSEFVFNTSLLPVNRGTIFLTHFDRTYYTTQNLLQAKDYSTLYMHGNNGSFWNRNGMRETLGYDVLYDNQAYNSTEKNEIGMGISDYDFFQQSVEILANTPGNYYSTLITLTNHTPWSQVDKYVVEGEEPLDCGEELEDSTVCRYLKATHYMDWAFGEFWETLEKRGLLENSAIVVYGDHPAKLPMSEMETFYRKSLPIELQVDYNLDKVEYASTQRVPFIIWEEDSIKPLKVSKVMGEFDAGPTLQNMLGIFNEFALGRDIFSIENNLVPFVNGDWVDGNLYYDSFRKEYQIMNDEFNLDDIDDYIDIQSEKATDVIDMSNMINNMDLIAYHESKLKSESESIGGKDDRFKRSY